VGLLVPVVLFVAAMGWFGPASTGQVVVGFLVPSSVMLLFWRAAQARLRRHDELALASVRLEQVQNQATERFLVDVAHELTPHRQRCSARDEAVAVCTEYQNAGADLKVAVPDVEIETDRHILRQVLHLLVGNAIRHGGGRVAIWGVAEGDALRLTVSDDGPGLPTGLGDAVFERYVDLGGSGGLVAHPWPGLALARALGEKIGAELGHKRDPSWSHFSVRLPLEPAREGIPSHRVPLEAGVR
jgi:signal transduction histidine kinase